MDDRDADEAIRNRRRLCVRRIVQRSPFHCREYQRQNPLSQRPPPRSSPLLHATAPLHRDPAVPARPHGLLQHVPDGQHDHDDMRGVRARLRDAQGLHADIRHDGGAQPPPRVVCAVLLSRRPDRGCELQRAGACERAPAASGHRGEQRGRG
ncbi:hypothetical protein BC936DRAFT_149311 [Jimgerdemannia flammicorona]|uniref:Uncharacterized protein n=1 Tax=Jimgerdemannia flammicorona TaxID=994334 RepID=A0A433D126_9FUNG|nr:hypothetical protein BC936DRAFT_149311 [Jimgerdemannia flammicorona]